MHVRKRVWADFLRPTGCQMCLAKLYYFRDPDACSECSQESHAQLTTHFPELAGGGGWKMCPEANEGISQLVHTPVIAQIHLLFSHC
jgi:hypothetical protein